MKTLLLIICSLLTAGTMLACPPDDPCPPSGGEGTGKPTTPSKSVK